MKTEKEFVAEFNEKYPIHETSGTGTGTYKYQTYLDGIDLRYGFKSRKSAEMDRAKTAKEGYRMYVWNETDIVCPHCKNTVKNRLTADGRCINCYKED